MTRDTAPPSWNPEGPQADASSPWAGAEPWALAFAAMGHNVTALDAAGAALAAMDAAARVRRLDIATAWAPRTELPLDAGPFEAGRFDHVLSGNVIRHGVETIVRRTPAKVARVTRSGGTFMATRAPGPEHSFCNAANLLALMPGFEVFTLQDRAQDKPGSWHGHLPAGRIA